MDLRNLTIKEIQELLYFQKITAVDIVNFYLQRIEKYDSQVKAFVTVTKKEALQQAKNIDLKIKNGQKLGRLAGIVMGVKDIFLTKGIKTTASSQTLKDYIPQYSSTVYQRLIDQDAILIGKTNTDTFAFGGSTENSAFFTTTNPWNKAKVPGGSSGGSAAAVAADFCHFALATDTGGSIRLPSSLCGISGLKPTYGLNSRYGITSMASSFDCPGVIAKNIFDLALLTQITSGADPLDSTTIGLPSLNDLEKIESIDLSTLKIGLPLQYFNDPIDSQVKDKVLAAADFFKQKGAKIVDISLPSTNLGIAVYYILVPSEISSNMARYDGIRFGQNTKDNPDINSYYQNTRGKFLEAELKRRILIGTYALSSGYYDAYYTKASKVRTLIKNEFVNAFNNVDLILAPVSPTVAWDIGSKVNDPLQMYLVDAYTVCTNVAGLPSLALPCGFNDQNLPVGFQLIGNFFQESKILSVGHQYQQFTSFHKQCPTL